MNKDLQPKCCLIDEYLIRHFPLLVINTQYTFKKSEDTSNDISVVEKTIATQNKFRISSIYSTLIHTFKLNKNVLFYFFNLVSSNYCIP